MRWIGVTIGPMGGCCSLREWFSCLLSTIRPPPIDLRVSCPDHGINILYRLCGESAPAELPSPPFPFLYILLLLRTKLINSGGQDCTIKIYDVHSKICLHVLKGFEPGTGALSFSPAGFRGAYGAIAGGAWNARFRVWDVEVCHLVVQSQMIVLM